MQTHATLFMIASVINSLCDVFWVTGNKKNKKVKTQPVSIFSGDSLSFTYFGHRYAFSLILKLTGGVLVAALCGPLALILKSWLDMLAWRSGSRAR